VNVLFKQWRYQKFEPGEQKLAEGGHRRVATCQHSEKNLGNDSESGCRRCSSLKNRKHPEKWKK